MPRNASVRLTDDIVTAWKASGATLADLIRRGLAAPDEDHQHAPPSTTPAVDEARLAAIEQELASIGRTLAALHQQITDRLPVVSGTEYEAAREQHNHERAHIWHRRLYEATRGKPFVTSEAATILGCISSTTAGGYLRMMVHMGLARQVDNRGSSNQWQVKRPPKRTDEAVKAHQGQRQSAA